MNTRAVAGAEPTGTGIYAICIACGEGKERFQARCRHCGFTPATELEMARSLLLSVFADVGDDYLGLMPDDASDIQARVRNGTYAFDEGQVARILAHLGTPEAKPSALDLVHTVAWIVMPIALGLFALSYLVFFRQ